MISPQYKVQADLLLQIIPIIAKEEIFALEGGTAINLFIRDMPRLSVDLDLKYLPIDDRETAIRNITAGLNRIKKDLEKSFKRITVIFNPTEKGGDLKLNCQLQNAQIKIEVNTITRGHILPVRTSTLNEKVQNIFGKFAQMQVVSDGELYGGKICAALDRQNPRDLFDIKLLLESEGITKEIKLGFIVLLLSHARPIHELLSPHPIDQKDALEKQFSGMSDIPFTYENYMQTRKNLIYEIYSILSERDREFLVSFKMGQPRWELFPLEILKELPAIKWKLQNIHRLILENPEKHAKLLTSLKESFLNESKF